MLENIGNKITDIGTTIKGNAENLGNSIKDSAGSLGSTLKGGVETVGGTLKGGVETVGGTATTKAKLELRKKELQDAFAELGAAYYSACGEEIPMEYTDLFERIGDAVRDINKYQQEIDRNIKNIKGTR
ncbi:MAG: hypothetical protein UHN88_06395 [Eubacterium sp.]|nr:hypothetical protein [Eubacterium sp.]